MYKWGIKLTFMHIKPLILAFKPVICNRLHVKRWGLYMGVTYSSLETPTRTLHSLPPHDSSKWLTEQVLPLILLRTPFH